MIAYDISVPRLRRRLARLLEGHGQRVQRSVFATRCTQAECIGILARAERWVQPGDSMIAWPVVQRSTAPAPRAFRHRLPRLPDFWIV